jgi:hypothetical protein
MNIDPMMKLILTNMENILRSIPDFDTIPLILQQQFQNVTDLFNGTVPIIQELF